jgi:hypothetical protein
MLDCALGFLRVRRQHAHCPPLQRLYRDSGSTDKRCGQLPDLSQAARKGVRSDKGLDRTGSDAPSQTQ